MERSVPQYWERLFLSKNIASVTSTPENPGAPHYIRVWPDLAQRWSVSRATAYRLLERGELPYMVLGQLKLVPLDAVKRFERAQTRRHGGATVMRLNADTLAGYRERLSRARALLDEYAVRHPDVAAAAGDDADADGEHRIEDIHAP